MSTCNESQSAAHEELRKAAKELHHAAEATVEHLFGSATGARLRAAARHAMKAGLAALDEADHRAQARHEPVTPPTPPTV
jgi:hypothetical protein